MKLSEEQYGRLWRKLAMFEGHRKGLPQMPNYDGREKPEGRSARFRTPAPYTPQSPFRKKLLEMVGDEWMTTGQLTRMIGGRSDTVRNALSAFYSQQLIRGRFAANGQREWRAK